MKRILINIAITIVILIGAIMFTVLLSLIHRLLGDTAYTVFSLSTSVIGVYFLVSLIMKNK